MEKTKKFTQADINREILERLAKIEEGLQPKAMTQASVPSHTQEVEVGAYPIPQEYRETVRATLNQSFGLQVVPLSDQPAFQVNIVVPEKYSSLTPEQMKMYGADIRSKVITYAEGVNGVKAWTEKVRTSFNPDVQAQITADRV